MKLLTGALCMTFPPAGRPLRPFFGEALARLREAFRLVEGPLTTLSGELGESSLSESCTGGVVDFLVGEADFVSSQFLLGVVFFIMTAGARCTYKFYV